MSSDHKLKRTREFFSQCERNMKNYPPLLHTLSNGLDLLEDVL